MSGRELITGATDGWRLGLRFAWDDDRYRQTVTLTSDADAGQPKRDVLSSVEGTRTEAWPASPPLQDLNFHDTPDGLPVALAVGMAGKSHWSVSWEASQSGATLVCDVACRVKEPPGRLVSTWRVDGGLFSGDGRTVEVSPSIHVRIESETNGEFSVTPEMIGGDLCLSARPTHREAPLTSRWRYRISIVERSGEPPTSDSQLG